MLGRVLHSIEEVYGSSDCSLNVILSLRTLRDLKLNLPIEKVKFAIESSLRSKVKRTEVINAFTINVVPTCKSNLMFELKTLRRKLLTVIVGGSVTITRALISKEPENASRHVVYAEGLGLGRILGI